MVVRTTISLPEDTAEMLQFEAKRRGKPVSQIVRDALDAHLHICRDAKRVLPFESLGVTGDPMLSQRMDEILAKEWSDDYDRYH